MKDKLKDILVHQLNECKIEPMEYIEYNKFIDRMTNEQLNRVTRVIQARYPKAVNNVQSKISSLVQHRVQKPSVAPKVNKQVARLKAIQNKYRVKQQLWKAKSLGNTPK